MNNTTSIGSFLCGLLTGYLLVGIFTIVITVNYSTKSSFNILITEQGYKNVASDSDGNFTAKKDGKDIAGFVKNDIVYITSK